MRSKEKVTLKWSKPENDWIIRFPEWDNRNGKITGNAFFSMIEKFEEHMRTDCFGKPTGFTNIKDYLSEGGFDPDTLTISVNAKIKSHEQ